MFTFDDSQERILKAICDGNTREPLIIRKGAWIGGTSPINYKFEKFIIGPGRTFGESLTGAVRRSFTKENIPLVQVIPNGPSVTYYAINALNVTVLNLGINDEVTIESEHILAFHDCNYDVRYMGRGVLSQGGMFATVLKGKSNKAQVAVLTDGDALVLTTPCACDPDAYICHTGSDPKFKTDVSWKTFIKQSSGESYMFDFNSRGETVIIQPSERAGEAHIGID